MKILVFGLGLFYLYIAISFLNVGIAAFKRDQTKSSEDNLMAVVILGITTILWPLVIPLSYLELVKREARRSRKKKFYTIKGKIRVYVTGGKQRKAQVIPKPANCF